MKPSIAARCAFLASLVVATGCAITDYELVTDNDQVSNGRGSGVVNTNGKALIIDCWNVATVWPDGTDHLFTMVDQKANGDRTLTTYNNFSTFDEPSLSNFVYCNPDWQGCAIATAPDPETGDDDRFDHRVNPNCFGARGFSVTYSTNRYYGECGRARVALQDRLTLLNAGALATRFGREGLLFDVDRTSLTVAVDDGAGLRRMLDVGGKAEAFVTAQGPKQVVLDLRHPLLAGVGRQYADFLRDHDGERTHLTLTYNGIVTRFLLGPPRPGTDASQVEATVRRRY